MRVLTLVGCYAKAVETAAELRSWPIGRGELHRWVAAEGALLTTATRAIDVQRLHNYGDNTMVDETLVGISGHLTVAQAAQVLGVSANQVRQLIATGELEAVKAGPAWMIPQRAVTSRQDTGWGAGRRLAPVNAWALLLLADGEEVPWLPRRTRWRLRHYLDVHRLVEIRSRLVDRGRPSDYRVHPSLLDGLRDDPALMLTGVTGAMARRLGLVGGAGSVDAYVGGADLDRVVDHHHLRESSGDPNVTLRLVPPIGIAWPPAHIAPVSAIALDLLESTEPRARHVGTELLAGLGR